MIASHRIVRARAILLGATLALTQGATVPAPRPAIPRDGHLARLVSGAMAIPAPSSTDAQAQLARVINAAVPVARGALFLARPFHLNASVADRSRALDCLAAADFYEAGGDPADQRAVAQVVLNRVRHAAFPATICGVVFEGAERITGCQFTFTCDGSLARRRPSPAAWQDARRTAAEMLLGRVEPVVGQATHYHTDWVSPPWDRTMDKLAVVKTHLFFRWRGASGAPEAFTQRYAGTEPRIPLLAALSTAHSGDGESAAQSAELATLIPPSSQMEGSPQTPPLPSPSLQDQGVFLVTLPAGAAPESFLRLARQRCDGLSDCRFVGWTDPTRQANVLPLPGSSVDAISFTFVRRGGESTEQWHWNCTEFPRANTNECLRRAN